MRSLFVGLASANLILLAIVFALGLGAIGPENKPTSLYIYHIGLALGAGFFAVFVHLSAFMYFMATVKWLQAAAEKANLPLPQFVVPAEGRKRRVFALSMTAVMLTMFTMFAGAGADPSLVPLWPSEVHLVLAIVAIMANALCHLAQFQKIRQQSLLMEEALTRVNALPGASAA